MIDISGLNKAQVLAALYNASRPQGMGFLNYDATPMNQIEAQELLNQDTSFDYVKGRVLKVCLKSNLEIDEFLYDRDNGSGAASRAIESLRQKGCVNNEIISEIHKSGKQNAANIAFESMNTKSDESAKIGGFKVFTLGLSAVKNLLEPKVKEALAQ